MHLFLFILSCKKQLYWKICCANIVFCLVEWNPVSMFLRQNLRPLALFGKKRVFRKYIQTMIYEGQTASSRQWLVHCILHASNSCLDMWLRHLKLLKAKNKSLIQFNQQLSKCNFYWASLSSRLKKAIIFGNCSNFFVSKIH